MKILQVIASLDPASGGPLDYLIKSSKILQSMGHQLEIISLDAADASYLKDCPFKAFPLGPGITKYGYSTTYLSWLLQNIQNYDCAIIHGIWQYHSYGLWRSIKNKGIPYYVFTHGMLDPWFKHTYPLKHLKKWIFWPWSDYRVLRDAAAVFFTCEEEKILARQSFWLYTCNEQVVNFGTAAPVGDPSKQKNLFLEQFPHLAQTRNLLYLSRIHPKKACDNLIRAFADIAKQNPSLHLIMAGPDQTGWVPALRKLADQLDIATRITWTGMLAGEIKWGAYYASEAFILPSHQENFGIVVAEALACGRPVLISNKINIWREIETDHAGLVNNDDVPGTLDLLNNYLTLSPQDYRTLSNNARASFENRFEIHKAVESLLAIIGRAK